MNAFTGEVLWLAGYAKLRAEGLQTGTSESGPFLPRILKVNARGPASPVVGDEVVVLAPKDAAGVIAFDRRNGEIRWRQDLLECRYLAGVCEGNLLAVDNTVTALSLATGKVAWEYTVEGKRLLGQPGYSGAVLYLPTQTNLQMVDARTGQALGTFAWDQKAGPLGNLVIGSQRIVGVNTKALAALAAK
ncbi:MAG: PQQ-binding-like beta-propeller repeat protein [Planctomycetota bacterium]|nr:PQQ-binding-like beta-propeller repeat protein [Planctomycetota bacterium]